jgi:hypothetical protein
MSDTLTVRSVLGEAGLELERLDLLLAEGHRLSDLGMARLAVRLTDVVSALQEHVRALEGARRVAAGGSGPSGVQARAAPASPSNHRRPV